MPHFMHRQFSSYTFQPNWSRPSSCHNSALVRHKDASAYTSVDILTEAYLLPNRCNCVHIRDCAIMKLVA